MQRFSQRILNTLAFSPLILTEHDLYPRQDKLATYANPKIWD